MLASLRVPDARGFVEGASHNAVSEGVVEGDGIDNVPVTGEGEELITGHRIEHLTRTIVRPSDEFVAALVKGAVGEGEDMGAKVLEEGKLLPSVATHLALKTLESRYKLRVVVNIEERF